MWTDEQLADVFWLGLLVGFFLWLVFDAAVKRIVDWFHARAIRRHEQKWGR